MKLKKETIIAIPPSSNAIQVKASLSLTEKKLKSLGFHVTYIVMNVILFFF